jgi:phosphoribosylformylglycinamidine (FGAM) synthase-like amidotransferase family enzyme
LTYCHAICNVCQIIKPMDLLTQKVSWKYVQTNKHASLICSPVLHSSIQNTSNWCQPQSDLTPLYKQLAEDKSMGHQYKCRHWQ